MTDGCGRQDTCADDVIVGLGRTGITAQTEDVALVTESGERGRDGRVIVVVTVTVNGGDGVGRPRLRRKASEGTRVKGGVAK